MDHGQQLKVLVTGAAGRIGSAFFRHARERYLFRLVDRPGSGLASLDPGDHETLEFDLSDAGHVWKHAKGPMSWSTWPQTPPRTDFTDSLLPNNIVGSYNLFEAARKAGCRRVVAASSVHAVSGYPVDVQVRAEMPVRPKNL